MALNDSREATDTPAYLVRTRGAKTGGPAWQEILLRDRCAVCVPRKKGGEGRGRQAGVGLSSEQTLKQTGCWCLREETGGTQEKVRALAWKPAEPFLQRLPIETLVYTTGKAKPTKESLR